MFCVTFLKKKKTSNHNHSTNNLSCPAGLTDLIRTQRTVMAAVREEAGFRCELLQSKDVVKVTWWKHLQEGMKNLISYHKKYGQGVNPAFRNKIKFTVVGLQNSSIVIRNVTEEDEGCYLCLFNIDPGDDLNATTCLTDVIRTQQTVMAAEGDEVLLNCELMQHKDVVKVIWWKILLKWMKNLISYHKIYGQDVNPAFKDKVEFTDVGLQNSSIFIRNVTEEDEGCYLCLFNIDPGDDLEATTCLQLYGKVKESGSEETVVSCSATGRPAPTVTLTVLRDNVHFPGNSSVSVNNTNGTVTVTSTAVLTRLHHMDTEVRCAVRVLSAPQKEEVRMIPAEGEEHFHTH
uniref:Ig-like domain-containing protein n=1 Tax=Sparus aurata TaxID=8175 RepID=A0A671XF88_SPAAU